MQLRWKASFSASCQHAAACMQEGLPVADHEVAAALQPAAEAFRGELAACGFDIETALPLLVSLAADYENNQQLVEMTCQKVFGKGAISQLAISRLAGCISDLEAAWLRLQPGLVEELVVRGRPLREQWEARGPGLLGAVAQLAREELIAPAAEVVLVSPLVGGHGRAHLANNRVTLEAVLTNPHPELPELLRLGWLLTQLNLDLPLLSEPIGANRLAKLANWATLPLVLAAAEKVELAILDEDTLQRVLEDWYLAHQLPEAAPQLLLEWWLALNGKETRWPVALLALDEMLGHP